MKSTLLGLLIAVTALLSLNSCKDDLNLIGNYKETPVVIGILNQFDTVHYIKVTRAFIGNGTTSSLDIAQIPDSNYFNNVSITVKEKLPNGTVSRTFVLHDTIIPNKDPNGVFYAPNQKVYVFYTSSSAPLLIDRKYALDISIDNGRIEVAGETELVQGMVYSPTISNFNSSMKLADNPGSYKTQNIKLNNYGTAQKLSCKIRFNYREFTTFPTVFQDKSITMNLGEGDPVAGDPNFNFTIDGSSFYNNIKNSITSNAGVDRRRYTSVEILTVGGSVELTNYINLNKPSTDLAQSKPEYSNLTVSEGFKVIGIFSSRQTVYLNKPATGSSAFIRALDQKSVHELCNGAITGGLLFCSDHTADLTASPTITMCQ